MGSTCPHCGQMLLSSSEFRRHKQTHLQTRLDKWNTKAKTEAPSYPPPEGLNVALFKVFEKYKMKDKAMLCLWHNGQLNTAICEPSRILELQDHLKEWLNA
ncbi:MAG: hypothetical protein WBZ36_21555 [Candidatus Nitrosopolaris sp.]